MTKLLVVDDEQYIRFFLERLLTREGYKVVTASEGTAALAALPQGFDLALLDINLGRGPNGLDILDAIHQSYPEMVVILLTGQGTLETAVAALRRGAHDYLLKPCMADEIRKSVRQGLAKRQSQHKQASLIAQLEQQLSTTLAEIRNVSPSIPVPSRPHPLASPLTIDKERYTAKINSQLLVLTPVEFNILAYLVEQAPQVVTPQQIVYATHQYRTDALEASTIVRSHIYRLRQKIKEAGHAHELIRTVRGVGYAIHA
jgi:DNA-binding response OmpR family regulator